MPIETKEAPTQTPEEAKALEYNNAIQQLIDSGEIENGINKLSKAGKGAGRTRGHGETIQGKYGKQWNTSGSKPLSVVQREDGTKITTNADAAEWAEGRNSYYSKHHIITVEKDGRTLTFSKSAGAEPEISEEGELRRQSPLLSEYNKKTLQENTEGDKRLRKLVLQEIEQKYRIMKEIAAATNADWKLPDITSLKEDAQKRKAAEVEASNAERQQKTIDERVVKPTRRGIIGSFLYNRKLLRRMNKLRKLQDERDILSKKEDSGDLSAHEKSRLYSLNTLIDVNRDILNKLRNS